MTESNTTISYEDLINKMNEKNTGTKTIKVLGENIEVKPLLSMDEFEILVDRIVETVFNDNGDYVPVGEDFAIRLFTVMMYTGVIIPDDLSPVMDDLYNLMYETEFYDQVVKVIDDAQYSALLNAVHKTIREKNVKNNSVVHVMKEFMTKAYDKLSEVLSEENIEALNSLVGEFENGNIGTESIVNAFADKLYQSQEAVKSDEDES